MSDEIQVIDYTPKEHKHEHEKITLPWFYNKMLQVTTDPQGRWPRGPIELLRLFWNYDIFFNEVPVLKLTLLLSYILGHKL